MISIKTDAESSDTGEGRKRSTSLELLRVVSMLMIVCLHYLSHGGALSKVGLFSGNYFISWTLQAFCVVAVNCYVLISGYFLVTSKFRVKKVITLWLQVFFYSIAILLVLTLTGATSFRVGTAIENALPVLTTRYWFATSYFGLYFLFPFLNIAIKAMSKKQMQMLIFVIFAMFSVWKNVLPFARTLDESGGYGIIWFVCLYIYAAYLRLYWNPNINKHWYLFAYIALSISIAVSRFAIDEISNRTGQGNPYAGIFYGYNSITVLVSSLMLFLFFKNITISNSLVSRTIGFVAGLTFGIYLISDHAEIRETLYFRILHTDYYWDSVWFPAMIALSVIGVFVTCALIETGRRAIFYFFENSAQYNAFCARLGDNRLFQS